jgi:hypothetical protein
MQVECVEDGILYVFVSNEDCAAECSPSAPMRQTEGLHEGRISGSS